MVSETIIGLFQNPKGIMEGKKKGEGGKTNQKKKTR
jgi:hypothetical protein